MKRIILFVVLFLYVSFDVPAQLPVLPLVKNNYNKLTSYDELSSYIRNLTDKPGMVKVQIAGQSVKGRDLYAVMFSSSDFGRDTSKIKVLLFAQQHGNEQSGKEGALLLIGELLKPENQYLFQKIDLMVIPQVNPDGSEINTRRNANGVDLNRNHLVLTEPETVALHKLFDRYLFEVTMDVHEYSPYGDEWKKYGYRKNFDVTLGATTNLNVAESIRKLSGEKALPFIFGYLKARNFSSFTYCPGGPPDVAYIRHSTFDINDGRQGFGIQNTFSFIQEGMNGVDDSIDNLKHRAEGQMTGMRGLLEYVYKNKQNIKTLISREREKLLTPVPGQLVSIQSVHAASGESLALPLLSYHSGKDTIITVTDYRPVVKSLTDVQKPFGYLIPQDCTLLVDWTARNALVRIPLKKTTSECFGQYMITAIDSIDFEGDKTVDPQVTMTVMKEVPAGPFLFIPVDQLKGNLIVLALEPKSELGLVTYEKYAGLLKAGNPYPVLRVMKK